MTLNQWAIKHGVSIVALNDLRRILGAVNDLPLGAKPPKGSEAAVQNEIRLEASRKGARIFRNNVGAGMLEDGSYIRWGIANDSKQMNNHIKSSDLIGIKPVLIEPHHVGMILGQFMAREVKRPDWVYTGTKREEAQLRFLELVLSLGGDAAFATSEGTI